MLVADGNMFREMTIRLFCHCADIIHCVRISEFVEKLQLKVPYIAANKKLQTHAKNFGLCIFHVSFFEGPFNA